MNPAESAFLLALLLATTGCPPPGPVPPPNPDASDAATPPPEPFPCVSIGVHIEGPWTQEGDSGKWTGHGTQFQEPCPNPDAGPPPPPTEASMPPVSPCQAACTALILAGCKSGLAPNCVRTMADHDGAGDYRTPSGKPLSCVVAAQIKTAADARALGLPCGP